MSDYNAADPGPDYNVLALIGTAIMTMAFLALLLYAIWRYLHTSSTPPVPPIPTPPPQCTTPDFNIDPNNCGYPGRTCSQSQICQGGTCICASPDEQPYLNGWYVAFLSCILPLTCACVVGEKASMSSGTVPIAARRAMCVHLERHVMALAIVHVWRPCAEVNVSTRRGTQVFAATAPRHVVRTKCVARVCANRF